MTIPENRPEGVPFSNADLVGPEDKPKSPYEITMYGWRAFTNLAVFEYMLLMAGAALRAVQCFVRTDLGLIYVRACEPTASKAHSVSLTPDHRNASFSLYTPLLPFHFRKVGKKFKVIFECWPEEHGGEKLLVIKVKGYRVERVDAETTAQAAVAEQPQAAAGQPEAQ